jgi:predicted nucleotidyltransferase
VKDRELHVREIERQTGLTIATVRQELQKLERTELVIARRDGNRLYYQANKTHPLYSDIHNLVLKTSGLVEVLKEVLDRAEIKIAFVFGSIAGDDLGAGSDVDLLVVSETGLRAVSEWLSGISETIGREVNPYILSETEFKKRSQRGEHFLKQVLNSPKLFIVGNEDDLKAMGG